MSFASLVGNGIQFITTSQKYELIKIRFNCNNMSMFTLLRKNMTFSRILLVCFTITFAEEVYLICEKLKIVYVKCLKNGNIGKRD